MPQFRIRHTDGDEEVVTAARAAVHGPVTIFEEPRGDATWKVVYQVPTAEVDLVRRQVFEGSGMARWVTEKPRRVSASRSWT